MTSQSDVRRITRALNWIGTGALGFGILVVVWALWWTRGVDDFRTAVIVAAIGFGLPSVVVLSVAWLLDSLIEPERTSSGTRLQPLEQAAPALRSRTPEWSRALRYSVAIGVVVAAALVRWWLDPILVDKSPFITFFLAVTIAAWVGGFGASALATALSTAIAWQWFLSGPGDVPPDLLRNVVAGGVFVATALAIGGITGALRAAARITGESANPPSRAADPQTIEGEVQRNRRIDESRIHAMADTAPVLIWMSDPAGARDHFNRQWLEFTGRTLDEALERRWEDAVHPQDRERYLRTCNAASDTRAPFRCEFRLRRFDGEYRWILDEGVPRFLPDGLFAGYVGACMDITDRKSAQHLLAVPPPESQADRNA